MPIHSCDVRAVLFDAVGTLIYPDPPVAHAYCEAGRRFGSSLTEDSIRCRFRSAVANQESQDLGDGHITSEANERRRWQAIVADVFHDVSDTRELFQALWDHFAQPQHWRLYEDAIDCWQRLTAAGYTLGVASNFDERLAAILAHHGRELSTANDSSVRVSPARLFVSSQVGHKKPSIAFFRTIEHALGLPPEQILLIGDDLENDYRAARDAGWQAVLLERDAGRSADRAALRITTLRNLPVRISD